MTPEYDAEMTSTVPAITTPRITARYSWPCRCRNPARSDRSAPPPPPPPPPADAADVSHDPPEPEAPVVECQFARRVQCHDGVPTRTALQPPPFVWCPTEVPAVDPNPSFHDA